MTTEVREFSRIRNGQEELVRAHTRGLPGHSERSATNYKRITGHGAVAAAKARLAAKGIII